MDAPHWNGDVDNRQFGPVRDICQECHSDIADDGHDLTCSYHADYAQPDVPGWMNEPNTFDDFDPRDEHDSPIDHDVEDL